MQTSSVKALSTKLLWRFSVFNIVLLLGLALWLWQETKSASLIQPQLPADGKLQCVSYSPYYHPGQTPLNPNSFIQPSQIDSDLAVLAKQFNCVRIYSVSQGLSYVPQAAEKLGMQVYLGAWIGWVGANNDKELDLAIQIANQYPKTVKALIVGNEVLLRGEQSEQAMQAYLSKAQQLTDVPVTYADVWEFWRKHPQLESNVDFVTVHILPYWEDIPQSIEQANDHVVNVMGLLKASFKKPILIGETGWPSVGRQRQVSQPSLINQANYLRSFLQSAHTHGWQYNLIEAIDQPWKRDLEGTVGGYWGLYDTQLSPKFSFDGDVQPRGDIVPILVAGFLGFLLLFGFALYFKRFSTLVAVGQGAAGAVFVISAYLQIQYLLTACRNLIEWIALSGLALVSWLTVISLVLWIGDTKKRYLSIFKACAFVLISAAIVSTILLIVDGRYRDFPISLFALAVLHLSFASLVLGAEIRLHRGLAYLMCAVLAIVGLYSVYLELYNTFAYYWLLLCGLIIAALLPKRQMSSSSLL